MKVLTIVLLFLFSFLDSEWDHPATRFTHCLELAMAPGQMTDRLAMLFKLVAKLLTAGSFFPLLVTIAE